MNLAVKLEKETHIPKELIYEMRQGIPIYYRHYKQIAAGQMDLEEVMGSSYLQALIVRMMVGLLFQKLDFHKYEILFNESGFMLDAKNWRNLDIAIYAKAELKKEPLYEKYVKTPPQIVIEIDTKADLTQFDSPITYFVQKTEDLLNAGVRKIIWIFTKEKKVLIAEKDKKWIICGWNDKIEIIEDIEFCLEEMLAEYQASLD